MNQTELDRALRKLRLSAMAATLPTRILQAQTESLCPHDFLANLVHDELNRRANRLIERRVKHAGFRDRGRTLDNFDFAFNPRMDKKLIFELASCRFVAEHQDGLFLGPPGTGKSHLAQAIGFAAIHHGYDVLYREAHTLVEQMADATLDGTRKDYLKQIGSVHLLVIDDLGMRKLPHTAAEDLLEVIMRRYERVSTIMTSNRPVEDWGKLLGDNAAVSALLDRLLHHAHVLKCGPKSYRTRAGKPDHEALASTR
jgi:DNA replication protein DnaC